MNKQKKKMSKGLKTTLIIILVVAVGLLGFSVYKLVSIDNSYKEAHDLYVEVEELVVTPKKAAVKLEPEQEEAVKAEVIYSADEPVQIIGGTHPSDPEWAVYPSGDTAKEPERTSFLFRFASLSLDFDALYDLCEDSVGWIYQENVMSYPLVQGEDNNQYMRNMINGQYNVAGTLFVDSRFPKALSGRYATIYGHNMDDRSMFGSITAYKDEEYYKEHPTFEIFNGNQAYLYHVYAALQIGIESDLFCIFETDDELFRELIEEVERLADRGKETPEDGEKPGDENVKLDAGSAQQVIGFEENTESAVENKEKAAEKDDNSPVMTYRTMARELNNGSQITVLVTCIDYPRDYDYRYVVILERDGKLYDPMLMDLFEKDGDTDKADDTEAETDVQEETSSASEQE